MAAEVEGQPQGAGEHQVGQDEGRDAEAAGTSGQQQQAYTCSTFPFPQPPGMPMPVYCVVQEYAGELRTT